MYTVRILYTCINFSACFIFIFFNIFIQGNMHSDRLFFSIALFKIDLFKCIPRYAVSVTYHIEKLTGGE